MNWSKFIGRWKEAWESAKIRAFPVESKARKGNAPGNHIHSDSHKTFDGIPRDCEIFEPSFIAHDNRTFQYGGFSHVPSLQCAQPNSD